MNVLNFLTPKNQTFYLNYKSTIRQALEKFDYHKFSVVPLIDDEGKYVSTCSEGDILRYIKNCANFDINKAENITIDSIIKYRPYQSLDINSPIRDVFMLASEQNFIPIIDDRGMFIGIIRRRNIIDYLTKMRKQAVK